MLGYETYKRLSFAHIIGFEKTQVLWEIPHVDGVA